MNATDPNLFRFDPTHLALIKETRARIKSELEAASIRVLRFSDQTQITLHKAGFRTVNHLLHPSPEQIKGVTGINEATKQEVRERIAWAYGQARRYFRRQLLMFWRDQLAQDNESVPLDEPDEIATPHDEPGHPSLANLAQKEETSTAAASPPPFIPSPQLKPSPTKHKTDYLIRSAEAGWMGKPGSRLYTWELKLRQQFEQVAWIGQLAFTEEDFFALCQAIREEAKGLTKRARKFNGQPKLVPAAAFITTMVFSARYAEQLHDEAVDEFWAPYLRTVWQVEHSVVFMERCRKRFVAILPYLEQTFGFEFPRFSAGNLVTAIFRHALIPRYMQADFAAWLRKSWRDILAVALSPTLLAAQLQQDRSLDYYSQRLKRFVTGKGTAETAAALIRNMAAAISLHVNDGETIEAISQLLAGTPIEQALWQEIAQDFVSQDEAEVAALRLSQPRLTWVWSLDEAELALRVQNIILAAATDWEGDPDRLVWLDAPGQDPREAEIEVEVSPWRMNTGERIIPELFLNNPDGPVQGELVLLTDRDEAATRLSVPPYPDEPVQFFRLTQQGAYGVPVTTAQVSDGTWLVCARHPLTFLDVAGNSVTPEADLTVPYPLEKRYRWAAQLNLKLPVTVQAGTQNILSLANSGDVPAVGRPVLVGEHPVAGLSRQVQPTFTTTAITLAVEYGGDRLLKQGSLWLQGQDGWRYQRSLLELRHSGAVTLSGAELHVDLSPILPEGANFYTLEFRFGLQPVLLAPLQFAIVPGLIVAPPAPAPLYTPANLPQLILQGLGEATVMRQEGLTVILEPGGEQRITWSDLRHDPHLVLRFERVDIPLMWPVRRFMAWLEPKAKRPFWTLDELHGATLHAVCSADEIRQFNIALFGDRGRDLTLKRGRLQLPIGQSQLYDMVRLADQPHTVVQAQVGRDSWTLFEVRSRPQLTHLSVAYDPRKRELLCSTGLKKAWPGQVRFLAESLNNPFAPPIPLAQTDVLAEQQWLKADLPPGQYVLRLFLDEVALPLEDINARFSVGEIITPSEPSQPLTEAIRGGGIIPARLAEDFVLRWAELAEVGQAALTPTTLFQLATVNAAAANLSHNFMAVHLQKLWPPLRALRAVQKQDQWLERYDYLPAWILLPFALTLRTVESHFPYRVYPLYVGQGGKKGYGFGEWPLSPVDETYRELVYVQWQPVSPTQVRVRAGLPKFVPEDGWASLYLEDTYPLYYCSGCRTLTGSYDDTLPEEIRQEHQHGRESDDLKAIHSGGYQLLAHLNLDTRGNPLIQSYNAFGINRPASDYWPEPEPRPQTFLPLSDRRLPLTALIREIKRHGNQGSLPLWSSAARLLGVWQQEKSVSPFGQAVFALCTLLRTAAYHPRAFDKLSQAVGISQDMGQQLLADLNQQAPDHLAWGLTWAELLYLHSPGSS